MTLNSNLKSMLLALLGAISLSLSNSECVAQIDNSTVKNFQVNRFMGKWHEIARYDHFFERGMTNVTAEYTLLNDGKIQVINRGIKNGKNKVIKGKAKCPDPTNYPGRLKVSFFLWFYSDYYVLHIDRDYTYCIIGSSSDRYLWIMSRTPQLPAGKLNTLLDIITSRGYDTSKLIFDN